MNLCGEHLLTYLVQQKRMDADEYQSAICNELIHKIMSKNILRRVHQNECNEDKLVGISAAIRNFDDVVNANQWFCIDYYLYMRKRDKLKSIESTDYYC